MTKAPSPRRKYIVLAHSSPAAAVILTPLVVAVTYDYIASSVVQSPRR
jgi:hypothetical protein